MRSLGTDYFRHDEAHHAMIGERTGETHRLGDRVEVKLVEAIPVAGALRFELLSEGRYDLKLKRGRGERRPERRGFRGRHQHRGQTMKEYAEHLTRIERIEDGDGYGSGRTVRPQDAATLVLVDRSGAEPRVLLGRRHERHVFLPNRFVFPGGRVDAADARMPISRHRSMPRASAA